VEENNNLYFGTNLVKMAALVAIFSFTSCSQSPASNQKKQHDRMMAERIQKYKANILPVLLQIAESGDIITRMGTDLTSLMLSRLNPTDTSFSHCGIISKENDTLFVYHSIGGEFNPNQIMRRDPLWVFAQPLDSKRLGIFSVDIKKNQRKALCAYVKELYKKGLPFDMQFDLATDEKQYCSEMVAKSISQIIGRKDWVNTIESENIRFIPIENIYLNPLVTEKKRFVY
jgi:Permuted papain-like amidase enzyme, YaeF/YiiX, C92 family